MAQTVAIGETGGTKLAGKQANVFQLYKDERALTHLLRKECADVLGRKSKIEELAAKLDAETDDLIRDDKAIDYFFNMLVRDFTWHPNRIDETLYKDINYGKLKQGNFGIETVVLLIDENRAAAAKLLQEMKLSREKAIKDRIGECEFNFDNAGE